MKRLLCFFVLLLCNGYAFAQNRVTLYGLLSEGIGYVNNYGGEHVVKLFTGADQNSRWGVKMQEDLGGGAHAVAQLENGFDMTDGELMQGGRMFGRMAYVGVGSDRLGTVTMGRQYDVLFDYLASMAADTVNGQAVHIGDADNLAGSWRADNSVKYVSPTISGFNASLMYAFSNTAGEFAVNRAWSGGASYAQGHFEAAVAYTELDFPATGTAGAVTDDYAAAPFLLFRHSPLDNSVGVSRQRTYGAGATYDFGERGRWNAVIDRVDYSYLDGTSLHLTNFDTSWLYPIKPWLMLGLGYIYTMGSYGGAADSSAHWHMANLSVDYLFSKRTDVFIYDTVNFASGRYATAVIYDDVPSTSQNQNVLMVGIRHKF